MNTDFIYEVKKKLRSKYNLSNHHKMKADFVHEDTDYLTKWFIYILSVLFRFLSDSVRFSNHQKKKMPEFWPLIWEVRRGTRQ